MNIVTALKTAIHSYSIPIMGGRELVSIHEYKLNVTNEYERKHLESINELAISAGRKPVFYKKENDLYFRIQDKGQTIPEKLDFTLILIQPFGITQNGIKITRHFA